MMRKNSSSETSPSPSRSASSIISWSSSSVMFSPSSLATRLRFLKEILPVSSSSKRRKACGNVKGQHTTLRPLLGLVGVEEQRGKGKGAGAEVRRIACRIGRHYMCVRRLVREFPSPLPPPPPRSICNP